MYICGVCGNQTKAGVPCNIVPAEVRDVTYPTRYGVGDPGGSGYETVREVFTCPFCNKES